jgi:hypothetical protein
VTLQKYTSCALLTLVQTAANGSSPPLVSIDMNGGGLNWSTQHFNL